jgi:DNA-binding protein YbaB
MNMFGNLGKMGEMLKQAKAMKDAMSKIRCEGEAGGVRVTVNGEMDVLEVKIPPEVSGVKAEGLVKEAANKALRSAKMEAAKKMQGLTGGLGGMLPGM